MFKKINNKVLIIVLLVLAGIYLVMELGDNNSKSENLRTTLVEIDTTKVDKIVIAKGNELLELKKNGNWQVKNEAGEYVDTRKGSVDNLIGTLMSVKPSRLVTKKQENWQDFQVDSAGTHVTVFEGDEKSLDLIVGRFAMQGQRQFLSYVRLSNEDEVYAADNFMSMSIGSDPADYRFKELIRINKDSVERVEFVYSDSAFVLDKTSGEWAIGGQPADSAKTAQFLNSIRYMNGADFADEVKPSALSQPDYQITIHEKGKNTTEVIRAFAHPQHQWILHSSHNAGNLFADADKIDKIFKSPDYFL